MIYFGENWRTIRMKINLFKLITENEVEYDERISEDKKDIQILMLVLVKIAFCITLIIDCFTNGCSGDKVPILYYTILLEMTIEPLIRCFKGAFENSKEFIFSIIGGCIIAGVSTIEIWRSKFANQETTLIILSIIAAIAMYLIYDWSYNLYLRKQDDECKN